MSKFLPLLLLATALPLCSQTADLKQLTDSVDRHYNHLSSFQAAFTETYSGNGISRSESGEIFLKKPQKMLWEYKKPQSKIFLTDGKQAYFYVPGEPQARRAPLKKLDDFRSPLRYLLGNTKLLKEFDHLQLVSNQNDTSILEGVPKGMEDRVSNVQLTVKNNQIIAIKIQQLDGSLTSFEFSNIQENVQLTDAQFHPNVPAGVHWIEGDDLNPQ